MSDLYVRAKARVRMTVEISLAQGWGETCDLGQVYKQAKESAEMELRRLLRQDNTNVCIIGAPEVIGIITEERK